MWFKWLYSFSYLTLGALNKRIEPNEPNQTKLFVNFKRAVLELKKSSCQTRTDVRTETILDESSRAQTGSIQLDSCLPNNSRDRNVITLFLNIFF